MVQIHKKFTNSQVKELIGRYLRREMRYESCDLTMLGKLTKSILSDLIPPYKHDIKLFRLHMCPGG